ARRGGWDRSVCAVPCMDRGDDLGQGAVLREVATGTGLDGSGKGDVVPVAGQDDDPAGGDAAADQRRGAEAVAVLEVGAEQRDVGAVMLGLRDRMVAVPGSRHDPEAGLTFEDRADGFLEQGMAVAEHDSQHALAPHDLPPGVASQLPTTKTEKVLRPSDFQGTASVVNTVP